MTGTADVGGVSLPSGFHGWRPGQRETVRAVLEVFADRKKHVFLDAPTGSGKSMIAHVVGIEFVRLGLGPVFYAVATKQLQDQYVASFPEIAVVKGRGNYACAVAARETAEDCRAERTLGRARDCSSYGKCAYFQARNAAMAAHHVVVNYSYLLSAVLRGRWPEPGLLVADEAHGIEDELTGHVGLAFGAKRIADLRLDGNPVPMPRGSSWAQGVAVIAEALRDDIDGLRSVLREKWPNPPPGVAGEVARQESFLHRIENVLQYARSVRWSVEATADRFRADPVRVAPFAEDVLWRRPKNVLLMSATLGDPHLLARRLGIPQGTYACVSLPSRFRPGRRPFVRHPVGRMAHGRERSEWPKVAEELQRIVRAHGDEKGLVHAVSFDRARRAKDAIQPLGVRVYEHEGRDRVAVLEDFRGADAPAVLISPSFEEGVDLPYEQCSFQVLLKVPFPSVGDPLTSARMRDDRDWYTWRTATRLVQAYGRGMRAEDDACATYILDSTYETFRERALPYLPAWFREAEVAEGGIVRVPRRGLSTLDEWTIAGSPPSPIAGLGEVSGSEAL